MKQHYKLNAITISAPQNESGKVMKPAYVLPNAFARTRAKNKMRQHYKLPFNWERTRFTRAIRAILNWL